MNPDCKTHYEDIRFIKTITLGSINPNHPLSEESKQQQAALLNRCLNESPKGVIIGNGEKLPIYYYYLADYRPILADEAQYSVFLPDQKMKLKNAKTQKGDAMITASQNTEDSFDQAAASLSERLNMAVWKPYIPVNCFISLWNCFLF